MQKYWNCISNHPNRLFKITKSLRIAVSMVATLMFSDLVITFYRTFSAEQKNILSSDLIFMTFSVLLLVYCAISLNRAEYRIEEKGIRIKDILRKPRLYLYSDIAKIEEAEVWPFKFTRLIFKDKGKRNIVPLDNQGDFVSLMRGRISNCYQGEAVKALKA